MIHSLDDHFLVFVEGFLFMFLMDVCLQEVTAPSSAAVDTSSAAAAESEPDEPKDTEPEDTVGLTQMF